MSNSPALFLKPNLIVKNSVVLAVQTDADGDGKPTTRMSTRIVLLEIILLLDNLANAYNSGRSVTDDQFAIYQYVEAKAKNSFGVDGRSCLMRFICELQKNNIKEWTIMGSVITEVFTPRESKEGDHLQEYRRAKHVGEEERIDSCDRDYATFCPVSVFNLFSSDDE